jgi:hypothetical protein
VGGEENTAAVREVITPILVGAGKQAEHLVNWLFFYLKSKLVCFCVGLFE